MGKLGANARKDWLIKAMVVNVRVELKVDTGFRVNLLPLSLYRNACTGKQLLARDAGTADLRSVGLG